ncbi:reverse transcriptase, partial [Phytophthora megakarya]
MTVQDELLLQQQQPQQPREKDAQWHQHQQHDVKQQQDESSRWGPPLPPTTIASRIADRLSELPAPRWGPLLPRDTVVSRIVERLEDVPAPRWGPPLPRRIVASRIAERLAPVTPPANSEVTAAEEDKVATPADVTLAYEDEESKECESPSMVTEETKDSEEPAATADEWLLKFDGGCRGAPGPGGAGAVLFNPSGAAAWSCSCYMPGNTETNNTAEYTALLLGARAAADHGATRLRVQGDSQLVIRQVKGIYGTKSTRLRNLRNATRAELTRVGQFTLHHIDRQDNAHADRLANRALDMKSTLVECADHPGRNACTTTLATAAEAAPPPTPPPVGAADVPMEDGADEERQADIDDGEVYAPMHFG